MKGIAVIEIIVAGVLLYGTYQRLEVGAIERAVFSFACACLLIAAGIVSWKHREEGAL